MNILISLVLILFSFYANASFWIPEGSVTPSKLSANGLIQTLTGPSGVSITTSFTQYGTISVVIPGNDRPYFVGTKSNAVAPYGCAMSINVAGASSGYGLIELYNQTGSATLDNYSGGTSNGAGTATDINFGVKLGTVIPASSTARTVIIRMKRTGGVSAVLSDCILYAVRL